MKDVQFRHKSSVGVCGGRDIVSNKCIYEKKNQIDILWSN